MHAYVDHLLPSRRPAADPELALAAARDAWSFRGLGTNSQGKNVRRLKTEWIFLCSAFCFVQVSHVFVVVDVDVDVDVDVVVVVVVLVVLVVVGGRGVAAARDKRQKVSQLAPISILASMLLGRVQLKNVLLFSQENSFGMTWR